MSIILSVGLLIFIGFLLGELAEWIKLPRISGYILAGLLLNPDLFGIMSKSFVEHTEPLLSIALSFITFSIGGALSYANLKAKGRIVLALTLFESLFAFLLVFGAMTAALYFFVGEVGPLPAVVAVGLVLASLAAPTDPSATLAVIHEYGAKGVVSEAMLEIAAFDDMVGIVLYTLVSALSVFLLGSSEVTFGTIMLDLGRDVGGAIGVGLVVGLVFNAIAKYFQPTSEGSLIVLTFGLVLLSYGLAEYLGFEALLSAMALGAMVINFNPSAEKIFQLMERYTDELIFVVFFALSGLHLRLSSISGAFLLIGVYILARTAGKFLGIFSGASLMGADAKVKRYAAGGLIPQGGVVIGLALLLTRQEIFSDSAPLIIGVVIGAALVHEIIGPLTARASLQRAGEIPKS